MPNHVGKNEAVLFINLPPDHLDVSTVKLGDITKFINQLRLLGGEIAETAEQHIMAQKTNRNVLEIKKINLGLSWRFTKKKSRYEPTQDLLVSSKKSHL